MAMDAVRKIYDHLTAKAKPGKRNIDLFIHSNGGDGTVPWRLVTLIREFANEFTVLVPHRAFSAATLTALGADSILMHPMGVLGPTDPTVQNQFNPKDPNNPNQNLGISVEDVTAYIALVKEDAGIQHEDEMALAFGHLASGVHPLALGNVKRSLSQSRMMARKLLSLHMDAKSGQQIDDIVDNLTSKLFYHGHPINRSEAQNQVGIPTVENPDSEIESLMWELYLHYERDAKMELQFSPSYEFLESATWPSKPGSGQGQWSSTGPKTAKLVYIESESSTDVMEIEYRVTGVIKHGVIKHDGQVTYSTIISKQGWKKE